MVLVARLSHKKCFTYIFITRGQVHTTMMFLCMIEEGMPKVQTIITMHSRVLHLVEGSEMDSLGQNDIRFSVGVVEKYAQISIISAFKNCFLSLSSLYKWQY